MDPEEVEKREKQKLVRKQRKSGKKQGIVANGETKEKNGDVKLSDSASNCSFEERNVAGEAEFLKTRKKQNNLEIESKPAESQPRNQEDGVLPEPRFFPYIPALPETACRYPAHKSFSIDNLLRMPLRPTISLAPPLSPQFVDQHRAIAAINMAIMTSPTCDSFKVLKLWRDFYLSQNR